MQQAPTHSYQQNGASVFFTRSASGVSRLAPEGQVRKYSGQRVRPDCSPQMRAHPGERVWISNKFELVAQPQGINLSSDGWDWLVMRFLTAECMLVFAE